MPLVPTVGASSQALGKYGGSRGLNPVRTLHHHTANPNQQNQQISLPMSFGSGGFSFGQQPQSSQNQTGGLFGQSSGNQNSLGGAVGTKRSNSFGGSQQGSSSLFGGTQNASTTPAFGQNAPNSTSNTSNPSGFSFGGQNTQNAAPTNQAPTNQPGSSLGGSLFGNSNSQPSGGLFGASKPAAPAPSAPTFGSGLGNSSSSLGKPAFGQSSAPGGLSNTSGGLSGGLFGGNNSATSKPGGLFGGTNSTIGTNSTFGANSAPNTNTAGAPEANAPQMTTSVDQAGFTLNGVKPSATLYTSLSVPAVKRTRDSSLYDLPARPHTTKSRIASGRLPSGRLPSGRLPNGRVANQQFDSNNGPQSYSSTTPKFMGSLVPADQKVSTFDSQRVLEKADSHHWINSYDEFLHEKPTILSIGHRTGTSEGISRIVEELSSNNIDIPVANARPIVNERPVSYDKVNIVRVNEQAIEEGYYISPTLDELAEMSKLELSRVQNLVIGREKYGQIAYDQPVNLSELSNLGDILGNIVVFESGTVCVYPSELTKRPPGSELNLPCTVTIEDAWPRTPTQKRIKDVHDPRMRKHVERLRKASEARGGEFVAFARGTWVFRVPHFSTWGLPTSEMVVEGDYASSDDEDAFEKNYAGEEFVHVNADSVELEEKVELDNKAEDLKPENNFFESIRSVSPEQKFESNDNNLDYESDGYQLSGEDIPNGEINGFSAAGKKKADYSFLPEYDDEMKELLQGYDEREDDVENFKFSSWREKLEKTRNGFVESQIPLKALERPTQSLSLAEMLVPPSKTTESEEDKNSHDDSEPPTREELEVLDFNNLREFFVKSSRVGSDLPLFRTKVKFSDLKSFTPNNDSLWELLSILHDTNEVDNEAISNWFDAQVAQLPVKTSSDKFEAVFDFLSRHNLKDAFQSALSLQMPHLSVLISMLGDKTQVTQYNAAAANQLSDWRRDGSLSKIPGPVKHSWELAAGVQPTISPSKISWEQCLGMRFWYSSGTTVQSALNCLPRELSENTDSVALSFLQAYSGLIQKTNAIKKLDLVQSFLCLQALENSHAVPSIAYADDVYYKLSNALRNAQMYTPAVYIALHISSADRAAEIIDNILLEGAVNVDFPSIFSIPERVMDEARAYQVSKLGDHVAEAEYLIRAGRYSEAHEVIISSVGPNAVLSGGTSQIVGLLSSLEEKSSEISSWERGGAVYLAYSRAKLLGPDSVIISSLCFDCRRCLTPSSISRRAVAVISEWVADSEYARTCLPVEEVVKMQFDPSQSRVQILQQAARLLK